MRPYNKDLDSYYSPDATPKLYITKKQVEEALNSIKVIDESSEIEVRKVIKEIEGINREEKLGKITEKESEKRIRNISNEFLKKYGFWPYITKTFERFYKYFEK